MSIIKTRALNAIAVLVAGALIFTACSQTPSSSLPEVTARQANQIAGASRGTQISVVPEPTDPPPPCSDCTNPVQPPGGKPIGCGGGVTPYLLRTPIKPSAVGARGPVHVMCGGGTPVALRSPEPGENCYGSQATLGDNLPANTSGSSTEITNIIPIFANNAGGAPDVIAWMYVTKSADWMQENTQFNAFWSTVVSQSGIPVLSGLAQAMAGGGYVQATSSQWSAVQSYVNSHNGYLGSCFTGSLG
jgi:hypothetical protein